LTRLNSNNKFSYKLYKLTLYQLYVKFHRKFTQTYSDNQAYDNNISVAGSSAVDTLFAGQL